VEEIAKTDVTTKFVGTLAVEKNDPSATTFGSPSFVRAMTTEFMMTLKKALSRPVQIASGSWATSDLVGTDLLTGDIPELLLANTIFSKKLDGFQGIRGSITLRLQATANPFQQGLLKLQFYPLYIFDKSFTYRQLAPESWSYWPAVELNLGKETACELRVPFTLPVSFCELTTSVAQLRPQMGGIFVKVYSPLKTGAGTATVGWNLYAHWNEDDLELFNPTPNIYQSGHSGKQLVHKTTLPAEKEKKSTSISDSLALGATIASMASGIPVLADIAGPTSWALRVASRVASALGFSRPPIDEKPIFVVQSAFPYSNNVEGPDVSMPLSLTIQPTLKFEPKLGGKTEDEMTIDSFVTKFGYNSTINLDSTSAAGVVLLNFLLGPANQTAGEILYPKPFQMLSSLFNFWRGNIRIRIKFIKTKMHTARLQFSFYPGVYTAQTLAQSEYVHREVVDISNVDELIYELPFTSQFPYIATQLMAPSLHNSYYGSFQIQVVNPLTCPSSVANNIDMIIETAMGEGSEWFCPAPITDLMPTVPAELVVSTKVAVPPSPVPQSVGPLRARNVPQSGVTSPLVKVSTLSDAQVTGHQIETSQLCVGEKLLSLRQLIKFPADLLQGPVIPVATGATGTSTASYFFAPLLIGACTNTGAFAAQFNDYLNLLAGYFRFFRGGMRVRGTAPFDNTVPRPGVFGTLSFVAKDYQNQGIVGQDGANPNTNFGATPFEVSEQLWKFTIPAWQNVPMVPIQYALTNSSPPWTNMMLRTTSLGITGFNLGVSLPGTGAMTMRLARQPADDYELFSFVGPPLMTAHL
jgi:hypothetical protein